MTASYWRFSRRGICVVAGTPGTQALAPGPGPAPPVPVTAPPLPAPGFAAPPEADVALPAPTPPGGLLTLVPPVPGVPMPLVPPDPGDGDCVSPLFESPGPAPISAGPHAASAADSAPRATKNRFSLMTTIAPWGWMYFFCCTRRTRGPKYVYAHHHMPRAPRDVFDSREPIAGESLFLTQSCGMLNLRANGGRLDRSGSAPSSESFEVKETGRARSSSRSTRRNIESWHRERNRARVSPVSFRARCTAPG
nr:MAG: hypothetical protein DIU78_11935 [Pseudomonadota bacterium]